MWTSLTVILISVVAISEGFHLEPGTTRAICMRAPPCCPGHFCMAYQRFETSRPTAACSRTHEGRPMYAPGSPRQQRFCGTNSRGGATPGGGGQQPPFDRRQPQFRPPPPATMGGPRFDMMGQQQGGQGRMGMQGPPDRFGADPRRAPPMPRFPGQNMPMPGQDMRGQGFGQGQRGLPEFPPMPSFDSMPQPGFGGSQSRQFPPGFGAGPNFGGQQPGPFSTGFGAEPNFAGQQPGPFPTGFGMEPNFGGQQPGQFPNGFGADPSFGGSQSGQFPSSFGPPPTFGGQQSGQFPPSFSAEQALGGLPNTFAPMPGQPNFGQGQSSFSGRDASSGFGGDQFSSGQGMSTGQRSRVGDVGFDQGQFDFTQPQSSFSSPSFESQSFRDQNFRSQSVGGSSFDSMDGFADPGFDGQSFGMDNSFSVEFPRTSGRGVAPMPFLAEQPPVSVTSLGAGGGSDQGSSGATQPHNVP